MTSDFLSLGGIAIGGRSVLLGEFYAAACILTVNQRLLSAISRHSFGRCTTFEVPAYYVFLKTPRVQIKDDKSARGLLLVLGCQFDF